MATSGSSARLQDLVERGQAAVDRARERSVAVDLLVSVVTRPDYANDTLLASYFAMRLFILLFPLAYTFVAGIGLYASNSAPRADEATKDVGLTGALAHSVAEAAHGSQRAQVVVLVVGVVLTVWAARGALRALRMISALVWRVPVPKTPLAEWAGVGFVVVVVLMLWLSNVTNRLRNDGWSIIATSVGLGLAAAGLWWLIAQRLPNGAARPADHLPGALVVGVAAPAVNLAVQVYFAPRLARAETTYGVLGTSLVLLTYLIVVGWTLVLACELSAAVLQWRQRGEVRKAGAAS